jgi:hypothetical protein
MAARTQSSMIDLSTVPLADYFSGKKLGKGIADARKMYKAMSVHMDGDMPKHIIEERRPNEGDAVKAYRKKIYKSKTKAPCDRVINTLSKIRRSPEWNVRYENETPSVIRAGETLHDYCEKNYPSFTSITNWTFSVLLKKYLADANTVCVVKPMSWDVQSDEYLKPVPTLYDSDDVVEFMEGLCIIEAEETVTIMLQGGTTKEGKIFHVITDTLFLTYHENAEGKFYLYSTVNHGMPKMPAFKVRGVVKDTYPDNIIFESRIYGMVPHLDEAAREYSDVQAAKVTFLYPEKWEYESSSCETCWDAKEKRSTGFVKLGNNKSFAKCQNCGGTGRGNWGGPYGAMIVRGVKTSLGEQAAPIPPMGYVEKSTEIVKHQDESVKTHLFDALSTVNMQFLADVPLSESGVSKSYDRDDFNNFVHAVAEDLVAVMDSLYYFICEYRYRVVVPNTQERMAMLPKISVPQNFDLLIADTILDEIKKAKEAGASADILNELQRAYASAKFYDSPEVLDQLDCVFKLDPMPGLTITEKGDQKLNGGVTLTDYIISCNIVPFVKRARFENDNFYNLDYTAQVALMVQYANEKQTQSSAAGNIINPVA